ncbi:TPA: type II secretion system F family protein [Enterobacter asburiae]
MFKNFFKNKRSVFSKLEDSKSKDLKSNKIVDDYILTGPDRFLAKFSMNGKARMSIYEKLGKFIGNGVPMTQALGEIYTHLTMDGKKPKNPKARIVNQWRRAVLNGQSFSRALEGWAPANEISVLEAGEISGRFEKAAQDVIFIYQSGRRIKSALAGLIYPLVLIGTTILYLYIFGNEVIPSFAAILPTEQWTGTGSTLAGLSDFVQNGLLITLITIAVIITIMLTTLGRWTGKFRSRVDKIPPWSIYRLVMGSNFLISLGALMGAGISVPDALQIISRNASPWYRERVIAARQEVLNGARNIGDALNRTGYEFPSWEMIIDIRAYASLAGFEDMLDKLSKQWLDDAVIAISKQMDVVRNIAIIVMGLLFMWIAAGMFDLQQQISDAARRG